MNKLRIVVVGPGLIGKVHIRLIQENPEMHLSGLVAPDHEVNHSIAQKCGVPLWHSLSDCVSASDVDGVVIASPNEFHFDQASQCIEWGIPTLLEKPITASLSQGRQLVSLVAQKNAKVLIGHHRAHSPLLAKARALIDQGRVGRLVSVMGSAQFYKPDHYFVDGPWRAQIGGGPILINLIHEIGNLRSLMGEIAAVQAIASSHIRQFPVEDTVAINLMFESGALGTFLLSDTAASAKSWELTSQENPSYPHQPDDACYTISGTRGSLDIPTMRLKYYPESTAPSWWSPLAEEVIAVERQDPLECQMRHFGRLIQGKEPPLVSAQDGFRNLLVTEAIRESAKTLAQVHVA